MKSFTTTGNNMNRTTAHPGDVLKEELEARGISQKKFSEVLSVPYTQLNEILNGKRPVTTDFALMMEAALGINPELLINYQYADALQYVRSPTEEATSCKTD